MGWRDWFKWAAPPAPPPAAAPSKRNGTLDPALLRKIHAIQIRARHQVSDLMAGGYLSAFKGRGMEFEEVREYRPGDDVRTIDWNVTARLGHPFVKEFREEREMTVMVMVDVSSSGEFGTHGRQKIDLAAELAAVLAYTAIRSNDKVGLLLFTDQVERFIAPKKGRAHVWRVIREVLTSEEAVNHRRNRQTNLKVAVEYLNKVVHRRSVCFLISDFLDGDYQKPLRVAARRHDLIAVTLADKREYEMPPMGLLELEDAETGEVMLVDTSSAHFQKQFKTEIHKHQRKQSDLLKSMGIEHIQLRTDEDLVRPLLRFFHAREGRR